jgi:integrase
LDWEVQFRLRRAVEREAARSGSTRKVGRVKSTAALLDAALELAGDSADAASTELEAAKRRRDGTMIAVLALMPMRLRAFATLELEQSVFIHSDRIDISLSGDMMKAGVPWEATVPTAITPLLRRYIHEVRPYFLARGDAQHSMLWTDSKGKPLEPGYLAHRIGQATQALVGAWISPHLFRDAAATSLARLSPKDAQLVRPLLGHQSFGVAERHYIQASIIDAGRAYGTVIEQLRSAER